MPDLSKIRTFPELLTYLQEELDWPIPEMDIREIEDAAFFTWYAEEDLGLDPKTAAKIKVIKQLRQIDGVQPFGIFFVEFDAKSLPVVAMRRILGKLVTRKRDSANPTERKTWRQPDLFFVSACGADETRRIDFAHFADDDTNGLPTLRVLGWDAAETDRRLTDVDRTLRNNLVWPRHVDVDAWRQQWRSAFVERPRESVRTSKDLARQLADAANRVRSKVLQIIQAESRSGRFRKAHEEVRAALFHDADEAAFADLYAQTLVYGSFALAVEQPGSLGQPSRFGEAHIVAPLLRNMLGRFEELAGRNHGSAVPIDVDEVGLSELATLLSTSNLNAVLLDFGRQRPGEDPVIYLYEDFMSEYDKLQRRARGVYLTPRPVVSFIIRSVDAILREEFGLPLGLADTTTWGQMVEKHPDLKIPDGVKPEYPFVQILDPATGTGTFLVEAIDLIHGRMREHWLKEGCSEFELADRWNEYVADHLLPRLYGFELMMAPYTIAHIKIGLKLADTGYRFQSSQRVRVFLTNTMDPPADLSNMLELLVPFMAHEARAATAAKRYASPTVIVGNPPYANLSANLAPEARQLVARLKTIDGVPIKERNALQLERNINDDYVKFLVYCENVVAPQPAAVVGLITNRSYLDARTLRGLRASLLLSFQRLRLIDLGGASTTSGVEGATADENVFEIEQPVGIMVLSRVAHPLQRSEAAEYVRVYGDLHEKRDWLTAHNAARLGGVRLHPQWDQFFLAPYTTEDGWSAFKPLDHCLVVYAEGLKTGCDDLLVGLDRASLERQLADLANTAVPSAALRQRYTIAEKGWGQRLLGARAKVARLIANSSEPCPFAYRPMDFRYVIWGSNLLKASSRVAGRHLVERAGNCALVVMRQVDGPSCVTHFFVSRSVPDNRIFYSKKGSATYFPLFSADGGSNFSEQFSSEFAAALGATWIDAPAPLSDGSLGPVDVGHYAYAIFHSPSYRQLFADALMRDFPRLPLLESRVLFDKLAAMGRDLAALHLFERPPRELISTFHDSGDREIRKVGEQGKQMLTPSPDHGPGFGRVYINDTAYFDGVPEPVWNFHIGGYQVCHKWLSDRKGKGSGKNRTPGRTLTDEDIAHYHKIVIALNETIRIMGEIDQVIEEHGGWPGAFVTEKAAERKS